MNAKEKRYKMGKERIVFVDYARALGIFLVVFAHCLQKYCDGMDFSNHFIYSFHMPLFFVISGMLLSRKSINVFDVKFYIQKDKAFTYSSGDFRGF